LLHVNLLFKLAIKKCGFHIHLMDLHVFQGHQCKNSMNRCKLCKGHKTFVVIHFVGLGKPLTFNFEHLFARSFLPTGSGTKVHVLFSMKELYSSYIMHSHSNSGMLHLLVSNALIPRPFPLLPLRSFLQHIL
jgi:hypothetical protein